MSSGFTNPASPVIPGSSPDFSAILIGDGAAGAPSFAFKNDPDTGIYRSNANELSVAVGGVRCAAFGSGEIRAYSNVRAESAGFLYFSASTVLAAPADGILRLTNNAQTDFSRLNFGGNTNAFPALKRAAIELQARLADDSNYTGFVSSYLQAFNGNVYMGGTSAVRIQSGAGTPEGNVIASVGSLFLRTDGGAGTTLYVKQSGAGNTGWVAK